jgi:6-phosphofructokinase 1
LLATRLAARAVEALARGETGVLIGWHHSGPQPVPLEEVVSHKKELDLSLLDLANILAR